MKKLLMAKDIFDRLKKLQQNTVLSPEKQQLIANYNNVVFFLLDKYEHETDEDKKLLHFATINLLTRIHVQQLSETLSCNKSSFSYLRSCFYSSESDHYHSKLQNILSSLDLVLAANFDPVSPEYIVSARGDQGSSLSVNLGPALIGENTEPSTSLLQLEKRLFVCSYYMMKKDTAVSRVKSVINHAMGINFLSYMMLGMLGTIVTGGMSMMAISSQIGNSKVIQSQLDAVTFENSLIKWIEEAKNLIATPEGAINAIKLFENIPEIKNNEILNALTEKGISVEQAEELWPRKQHTSMYCPISLDFLVDPVLLGLSGHTFNRASIEKALKKCPNKDPLSNEPISCTLLVPNFNVRSLILEEINNQAFSNSYTLKP